MKYDLLPLDDRRWSRLRHAYGYASDTPELIDWIRDEDRAGGWHSGEGTAWFEVYSSVCHQYSVYPATYAFLPHLIRMTDGRNQFTFIKTLWFCATVVSQGQREGRIPRDLKQNADIALGAFSQTAWSRVKKLRGIESELLHSTVGALLSLLQPSHSFSRQFGNYVDGTWDVLLACQNCEHQTEASIEGSETEVALQCEHLESSHSPVFVPRTRSYREAIARGRGLLDSPTKTWTNTELTETGAAIAAQLKLIPLSQHILDMRLPLACPECEIPNRVIDWTW